MKLIKKHARKLFAVILSAVMICALTASALAQTEADKVTVEINNAKIDETYSFYKVLDLKTSTSGENTNYAYSVNSNFTDFFKTFIDGAADLTGAKLDAKVYDYISGQPNDSAALRELSVNIGKYIKANTISPADSVTASDSNVTDGTLTAENLLDANGYYIMVPSGNDTSSVMFSLGTGETGKTFTITNKSEYPVPTKTAKGENTSSGDKTVALGEKVNFQIKSTVPDMTGYLNVYKGEGISKLIVGNPDKKGTSEEKTSNLQGSYIGIGESVTYRLVFDEYWAREYTLSPGAIVDELPNTSNTFDWKIGENVHVEYRLCQRDSNNSLIPSTFEPFNPGGDEICTIAKKNIKVNDTGSEKDIWCLSWNQDIIIPPQRALVIYVTLDFPSDSAVWDSYVEAADTDIYNIFRWYGYDALSGTDINQKSYIYHRIARPTAAYLKTGMYATDSDPNGFIYANSDEKERTVSYYTVIYNHGASDM